MKQKRVNMSSKVEWKYNNIESINDLVRELRRQANWLEERKQDDDWELDSLDIVGKSQYSSRECVSAKFTVNHELKTED